MSGSPCVDQVHDRQSHGLFIAVQANSPKAPEANEGPGQHNEREHQKVLHVSRCSDHSRIAGRALWPRSRSRQP